MSKQKQFWSDINLCNLFRQSSVIQNWSVSNYTLNWETIDTKKISMSVRNINKQKISYSKIFHTNYSESICNGVDMCFFVIPNDIVKVLKTLQ